MVASEGGGGAGVGGQRISRHLWPSFCRVLQHRTLIGLWALGSVQIFLKTDSQYQHYSNNEGIL
jgi:hypothetical protein